MNDAVVGGIRERGSEAVGLLIVGAVRIVIAVMVLGLLLVANSILGYDVSAVPFAGMAGISGLVSWLLTRKTPKDDDRPAEHDSRE